MARIYEGVTPSGVPYKVRALVGDDQVTLTSAKNTRDGSGFNKLLADCLKQLGDLNLVDEDFVGKMLSNDRKDMLVQLRQFSLKFRPTFEFNYDWPVKKGSGGRKELQAYSVDFNEEGFRRVPYVWVSDKVAGDDAERLAADPDYKRAEGTQWPVCYQSYTDMLNEQQKGRKYTCPESGAEVTWELLTGIGEKGISAIVQDNRTTNTPIQMRRPTIKLQPKDEDAAAVITSWEVGKADILDVEGFREEYFRVEGTIDTILTIEHQTDSSRQARVDLVQTVDFFYPSRTM